MTKGVVILKYTEAQQEVIDHWEGNLQIIACAGSGKTDVITRRIAKLILTGVHPREIVAFTFTENAADEMKFRIRKHLQELRPENPEIGEMYVGTIHSFCYKLLQEFKPEYKNFDVLDEHKRVIFVSAYDNYYQIGLQHLFERRLFSNMKDFLFNVDVLREELIPIDALDDTFRECFEKYEQLLKAHRFLDFSGMMFEVYHLLMNDEEFAKRVFEQYQYFIVDEYQDINPIQEKIIEAFTLQNNNLCVVGDDDQCIYQWRGSSVENLLTFSKRYPQVKSVEITTNFRSSKVLIDNARKFIEHNFHRLPKQIAAWEKAQVKFEPGDLYVVKFETFEHELQFIIERIFQLRGTKYRNNKGEEFALDYRDMAIFFRSVKNSADRYIKAFKEANIPFIVKGGGKLFEQDEVLLVVEALAFLGDYDYGKNKLSLEFLARRYSKAFSVQDGAINFIQQLGKLKASYEPSDFISLQGFFHLILGFLGTKNFKLSEAQEYNLGMLSQAITDFEAIYKRIRIRDIKYFLGYINGYAKWNYEEGGTDDPTKINAVKIMTVHRAKGLQFPVVFVPHLMKGRFPSKSRGRRWLLPTALFDISRYHGTREDERRLFYVAITRSEKFLFLSTHLYKDSFGGRINQPSPFLREYPKEYALTEPVPDPTYRPKMDLKKASPLNRFATSYSDLRYYDRCPYDYKLRFIYGFNPEINIALGYGRSIHNILNLIHKEYRGNPPDEQEIRKIVERNFFLRYCTPEFVDRFKESAYRIVANYVKRYGNEFNLVLETEKNFEFALEQALISGQIDLIKILDEKGELEAIEIVDFKEHDSGAMATDHIKQLRLYAIAAKRSLGFLPKKATIHHLDAGTRTEVDISDEVITKVENEVKKTIENIISRKFPKKPGKKKCQECDWSKFCPGVKK